MRILLDDHAKRHAWRGFPGYGGNFVHRPGSHLRGAVWHRCNTGRRRRGPGSAARAARPERSESCQGPDERNQEHTHGYQDDLQREPDPGEIGEPITARPVHDEVRLVAYRSGERQ